MTARSRRTDKADRAARLLGLAPPLLGLRFFSCRRSVLSAMRDRDKTFFGRNRWCLRVLRHLRRFEGVLATRFIIRIAFGIVRFTFGNFVVFHIIGLIRVNGACRLVSGGVKIG
jgi:hypothetical protein